jgi:hypothetical protein
VIVTELLVEQPDATSVIVQVNVFEPLDKLDTLELLAVGVVIVAEPVHRPVSPTPGEFPANVAEVEQTVAALPAIA